MRYHVSAWDHPTLSEIDGEFDELPINLREYPAVNIALLRAVSYEQMYTSLYNFERSDTTKV